MDPQWLVGEWDGQAYNGDDHHVTEVIHLTITRVEGNRVFGSIEVYHRFGRRVHPMRGTLQENNLTMGPFNFTVYGRRMTGSGLLGVLRKYLELTKM
jgi:hypothetical protein